MIIRKAKELYYRAILNKIRNNSSKLWSHINLLMKAKSKPNIPIKFEELNNFFTSVFKQAPPYNANLPCTFKSNLSATSFYLKPITAQEIITTMKTLSNSRAFGSDGFDPLIIKDNIIHLSNQLEYIFNMSFTNGVLPNLLKSAIISSIYKGGNNCDAGNYRPISILTIFSKLLEKIFYNRLIQFVNSNSVLKSNQFGFQTGKSMSSAIAHVTSVLINKTNNNKHTAFVLLDLKKAFDLVNHELLLTKLSHFGIRGLPLAWL